MLPDSFHERWDGPHWRWWALLAGVALTVIALGLAVAISTTIGGNTAPLAFLFVTLILFALSMIGSGMFDGLAGRAISGGLARQPSPDNRADRPLLSDNDRARRDRRTIRSGLIALPVFAAFLTLLLG